jgi:hypothetical protein
MGIEFVEDGVYWRRDPGKVAKFDGVAKIARQDVEQSREAIRIHQRMRRQLKQNRPEFPSEMSRPRGSGFSRAFLRVLGFLLCVMKRPAFTAKKPIWCGVTPGLEGFSWNPEVPTRMSHVIGEDG